MSCFLKMIFEKYVKKNSPECVFSFPLCDLSCAVRFYHMFCRYVQLDFIMKKCIDHYCIFLCPLTVSAHMQWHCSKHWSVDNFGSSVYAINIYKFLIS